MGLTNAFDFFKSGDPDDDGTKRERHTGKIMFVNKKTEKGGYGFISSVNIPYTRIFFYWTELMNFDFMKLEKGMEVSFFSVEDKDKLDSEGKVIEEGRGWVALKVRVEEIP